MFKFKVMVTGIILSAPLWLPAIAEAAPSRSSWS